MNKKMESGIYLLREFVVSVSHFSVVSYFDLIYISICHLKEDKGCTRLPSANLRSDRKVRACGILGLGIGWGLIVDYLKSVRGIARSGLSAKGESKVRLHELRLTDATSQRLDCSNARCYKVDRESTARR